MDTKVKIDLMVEAELIGDALGNIANAINHLTDVIEAKKAIHEPLMLDFADELFVNIVKEDK